MESVRRLPVKLNKQPIIDAVFEIRFSASMDAELLLPGLLIKHFGADAKVEHMPLSDVPVEIRKQDSNLRFQPMVRVSCDGFFYFVGSESLSVGCGLPYPGWDVFQKKIAEAVEVLESSSIVTEMSRYSLKYTDLLDYGTTAEIFDSINLDVRVANRSALESTVKLLTHMNDEEILHIVQVIGPASVQLMDGRQKSGVVLSVDSIFKQDIGSIGSFRENLRELLNSIHSKNKLFFFSFLKESALKKLGAVYD